MPVALRLALLVLLLAPASRAAGLEVVVGPGQLDPALLAEELEIAGSDEAAVLVVAGLGLDRLEVAFEPVDLASLDLKRHPPLLLRGLEEGLVNVTLSRDGVTWDGQLRLFRGRITRLDADQVLLSAKARQEGTAVSGPSFDLFGFYDALDERDAFEDKLAWCAETLESLDDSTPDHRLVSQACQRVSEEQARLAAGDAMPDADSLGDDLDADRTKAVPVGFVYRKDGRPRQVAPGTPVRVAIALGAGLGGGLATYGAIYWEAQAQQEYVAFRNAERLGDTIAAAERLYYTKQFDTRRDGFAVGAGLLFTGAITSAVFQAVEERRFRRARARVLGTP